GVFAVSTVGISERNFTGIGILFDDVCVQGDTIFPDVEPPIRKDGKNRRKNHDYQERNETVTLRARLQLICSGGIERSNNKKNAQVGQIRVTLCGQCPADWQQLTHRSKSGQKECHAESEFSFEATSPENQKSRGEDDSESEVVLKRQCCSVFRVWVKRRKFHGRKKFEYVFHYSVDGEKNALGKRKTRS